MLSAIRAFAQTWFAKLLFILLIASFCTWGIRDMIHPAFSDAVVTAGGRQVTGPEFKRLFDRALQQVEQQQQGQAVTVQDAVAAGFDQRVLSDIAGHEASAEYAKRMGVIPATSLVADEIIKVPNFAGPNGKFDPQTYRTVLGQNGLNQQTFEAQARDDLALDQLDAGLAGGLRAPKTYAALFAIFTQETRDLSFFVIDPNTLNIAQPTDAQLQAYLNQNAQALKAPEMRQLTVVRFSAKALAGSVTADPADVQKLYDFRKDSLSTPEKRSLVQIQVKDAATAASVAAKLKAGQDPATVAKSVGAQPLVFTDVIESGVSDPKVGAVAFAMKAGDVSGPIQGSLGGVSVIKLTDVKPGHTPTLDEMRPQLEAQAKTDAAGKQVYAQVQKYEDAHSGGANLIDSAKAAGGAVASVGPVSADGSVMGGAPPAGLTPRLLREAFKLRQGGETDLISESSGEYFAVRADKVLPPATPSLDQIKPMLLQHYMYEQAQKALQAKGDALMAQIRKGQSLDAAAAGIGAKVGHATGLTRAALSQNQALSPDMAAKLFAAKTGEVFSSFSGSNGPLRLMVAQVSGSGPPPVAQAALQTARGSEAVTGQLFQDLETASQAEAKAQIKPTIDPTRERQALGLSADSGAKPGALAQ